MRNKIIFMLLLIFSFTLLVGCNLSKEPTDPTQTVDNSVRVKFYVDDEIYSSKKHDKGSEIKLPEDPVKEGYKFIGWYTEDGDIISKKFIVEEALNIYAKFEEIESTIKDTYIVNFYIEEKLYYSIEVEKNNKIPGVEDPMSPTGYYFYGWVDDNNKEVSLSDKVNSNLNLHAVFYPILEPPMQYYEVYYYVEGGLYSIETYEPGIYITPSFEPYLSESYQFIGWFDEYGNQYYGGYIYENISLYAEFKEITYEVRYYVDGSLDKVENYQKGSYIDYLYTPTTPYNYNFVGWFDEYGNQYYCGYIYSNINLYAKFEEIIPFTYNEYDSYIEITGYIGTDSNVIIPDYINGKPVTHVASNFQGNSISNIKTLKIGKNISYIENGAFSFGKGLESVYCDSIEYWLNITFNGYTANPVYCDAKLYVDGQLLEHVEIPSHITEIKPYTFILSTLKTINLNNVITIGELAFYKSALTELYLPASVRNIGLDTFSLCTSLVKIDVDYMNPVYKSGYLCINSAMPTPANTIIEKSTGNLILGCSNSHITSDVTNISYGSLSNFMAETLYIPSTVTSIDQSAFLGMQSTIDVYYNGSYEQWISITGNNIYFKNVYYDYQWTYKDNKFVTDVLFNGNVYYSYVDEEYQIVGISRSESIGDVVDLSLHFDTRFSIDLDIVHIENMFNKNIYQFIIDKNTSSIDIKNYFYGYPIFYYESNESDWNNVLLSDNVIDYFFVYYYSEVQPTQDGYYWHYDEFGQPAIWDELIIPTYNGFTYIEYEYYIEITGYIGNSDVVEIPTEINGMPVISIADNSFEGCNFKELIIPSIINDIGNNILRGCDNLEKLTIPYYVIILMVQVLHHQLIIHLILKNYILTTVILI